MKAPLAPVGIRLERVSAVFRDPAHGNVAAVDELDLEVQPGELLTLLGPSGCGKTTTLRMVAGFQVPSAGEIFIGNRVVTTVPANKRNIGFVFQSYALFPHLSIFENIAYGLRVQSKSELEIAAAVGSVLDLVGLAGLGRRAPGELSGGQQQRVALARAIVIRPRVLLFDEPLSNLDAKLRVEMRAELRNLQKTLSITALYVTHDQEEAMAISDRIAVMKDGRLSQLGTAADLYRRPTSTFVASFLGRANILTGTVLEIGAGRIVLGVGRRQVRFATTQPFPVGSRLSAVIRPEAVTLRPSGQGLPARLTSVTYLGDKTEYALRFDDAILHAVSPSPPETSEYIADQDVGIELPLDGVALLPA